MAWAWVFRRSALVGNRQGFISMARPVYDALIANGSALAVYDQFAFMEREPTDPDPDPEPPDGDDPPDDDDPDVQPPDPADGTPPDCDDPNPARRGPGRPRKAAP